MAELVGSRTGTRRPRGAAVPGAIEVVAAPPLLVIQDEGRAFGRGIGIPRSGAMDLVALRATNRLVGNAPDAAALEWAGGGGRLRIRRPLVLALGGARAWARLHGRTIPWGTPVRARPGDLLEIEPPSEGRFLYIAIGGGIAVPHVLGARATYRFAALGGLDGRTLARGDLLPVGAVAGAPAADADAGALREAMTAVLTQDVVGVRPAPSAPEFPGDAWEALLDAPFTVLPESDRMGLRLAPGEGIAPRLAPGPELAARPSEPACVGLVQVPPDGRPLVLMPDGPTLGGYPALACVRSDHLPALAQRPAGAEVRFVPA